MRATLFVTPGAFAPLVQFSLLCRACRPQRGAVKQAGRDGARLGRHGLRRHRLQRGLRLGQHGVGPDQIVRPQGRRVVHLHATGKAQSCRTAGRDIAGGVLQRMHRMLALQAAGRQTRRAPPGCIARARSEAADLRRVRGPGRGAAQCGRQQTGVPSLRTRQVLSRHQHRATDRVLQWRVVQVLADIELVGAHRVIRRQADVLQQHQIHGFGGTAAVVHRDLPGPDPLVGRQHQLRMHAQRAARAGHIVNMPGLPAPFVQAPARVALGPH